MSLGLGFNGTLLGGRQLNKIIARNNRVGLIGNSLVTETGGVGSNGTRSWGFASWARAFSFGAIDFNSANNNGTICGHSGNSSVSILNNHLTSDITRLINYQVGSVVLMISGNDPPNAVSFANTVAAVTSIISRVRSEVSAGVGYEVPVIICNGTPRNSFAYSNALADIARWELSLENPAAGIYVADTFNATALSRFSNTAASGVLRPDNTHLTTIGAQLAGKAVANKAKEVLPYYYHPEANVNVINNHSLSGSNGSFIAWTGGTWVGNLPQGWNIQSLNSNPGTVTANTSVDSNGITWMNFQFSNLSSNSTSSGDFWLYSTFNGLSLLANTDYTDYSTVVRIESQSVGLGRVSFGTRKQSGGIWPYSGNTAPAWDHIWEGSSTTYPYKSDETITYMLRQPHVIKDPLATSINSIFEFAFLRYANGLPGSANISIALVSERKYTGLLTD